MSRQPEGGYPPVHDVGGDEEQVLGVAADEDEEGQAEVEPEGDAHRQDGDGDQKVGAEGLVDGDQHLKDDFFEIFWACFMLRQWHRFLYSY